MTYIIKEIFYSLQGEGIQSGRAAVFCRFSGCNLWSGREEDRSTAICQFCDTDFVGTNGQEGGKFTSAQALVEKVAAIWHSISKDYTFPSPIGYKTNSKYCPFVICTGGEPLLQLDIPLINAFHQAGFEIAVETNGTLPVLPGIDWICVSPKANAPLELQSGDELKLVFPQPEAPPTIYQHLDFKYLLLQPLDGPEYEHNTQLALRYCLEHPQWRLSLQTHKILGIL
jgi:7-carboxy-7-deazaguanine synthase (Cx14CxxC type)